MSLALKMVHNSIVKESGSVDSKKEGKEKEDLRRTKIKGCLAVTKRKRKN